MMTKKKEFKLERISFRVDPRLLPEFEKHCKNIGVTRSEAIRTIFNQNVVMPKVQANSYILNNNAL